MKMMTYSSSFDDTKNDINESVNETALMDYPF